MVWGQKFPGRPKVTVGKLGFSAQIFPRALPNKSWKVLAWKPSIFPVVPLAWVAWGPNFPKFIGRPGQRRTMGKMGIFSPDFPQSFLQVILFLVVWGGGVLPINFGNFGPKPPRPKETIGSGVFLFSPKFPAEHFGENLGWRPSIFPKAFFWAGLPINLGNFGPRPPRPKETIGRALGKIWAKNPPVSLWLPLAWVAWVAASSQWILGIFVPKGDLKIQRARSPNFGWSGGGSSQ